MSRAGNRRTDPRLNKMGGMWKVRLVEELCRQRRNVWCRYLKWQKTEKEISRGFAEADANGAICLGALRDCCISSP